MVLTEKQRLAGQLQVAEAEKRLATEQVGHMQEEVKVERAEKAKLAEGVKALAARSDQLAQEIQQNRPLAPNTIFNQFVTNRVQATIWAVRPGFLGLESNKRTETQTVLVTDGTNTVALCHVQDTPLSFSLPGHGLAGADRSAGAQHDDCSHPVVVVLPTGPARGVHSAHPGGSPSNLAARLIAPRRTPTSSRMRCWSGRRRAITANAASRLI